VKPIEQYATLSEFTSELDQQEPVPLKIMGKKRPDAFCSLSMLTEVHQQTPNPDAAGAPQTIPAPFGEILVRGARLHEPWTYSTITPHPDGQNHFQGDIVELDLSDGGKHLPRHRFSMLLSHSCDVQKFSHLTLAPAYLESELNDSAISALREGKPTKDGKQIRGNWFSNEVGPYLGLPATDLTVAPGGERILVCLHLAVAVQKKVVIAKPAQLRLRYRASSYLQGRLAVLLMRDVQRSDETREM